jgi:hypothetical protein
MRGKINHQENTKSFGMGMADSFNSKLFPDGTWCSSCLSG